jgi:hypothetical protein
MNEETIEAARMILESIRYEFAEDKTAQAAIAYLEYKLSVLKLAEEIG